MRHTKKKKKKKGFLEKGMSELFLLRLEFIGREKKEGEIQSW